MNASFVASAGGSLGRTSGIPYDELMAAINVRNVTKQYGTRVVLNDVTLEINAGETVGLVGANGAGKTTLFRLITGEISPDLGTITVARGVEIGVLKQMPDLRLDRSLHDEVGSVFADLIELEQKLHAIADEMATQPEAPVLADLMDRYDRLNAQFIAAGGHTFETNLNEILGGLGFSPNEYSRSLSVMSGGQRCRAALAKLLLQDSTLLLLDEPTNHLDIDAVRWLEKFLASHHGGAVIVSHDRYLLDRVCDRIVEIEHAKTENYPGNYSNFADTKERRRLTLERQLEKDMAFIEKEKDFIAKHMAGQRSKEARGRRTRLERRLSEGGFVTELARKRRTVQLSFDSDSSVSGTVVRCDNLSARFGDHVVFRDVSFQFPAGQRLGITGPNGTGKTTLLRVLLRQLEPAGGEFWIHHKCSIGYYSQDERYLDPNRTVIEEIRAHRPDLTEERARSLLGHYLFTREDVFKPLGALSGGEQSRVRLASLILQSPDLLVLDEPTNHLDIPSREALENALEDFAGAIIVVSHDRYFLDQVVDRLLVMRPEGYLLHDGDYSSYLEFTERQRTQAKAANAAPAKSKSVPVAKSSAKQTLSGPSPYDHLSVGELESMIMVREEELAGLQARFADPAVMRDAAARSQLDSRIDEISRELAYIEKAWLERSGAA